MMTPQKFESRPFADRARRSAREIVIAVILTCAAIAFIVTAVHGSGQETADVSHQQNHAGQRAN